MQDIPTAWTYRNHILVPRRLSDGTYVVDIYAGAQVISMTLRWLAERPALEDAARHVDSLVGTPAPLRQGYWRKGEDWWTEAEAENGAVPCDAEWVPPAAA